ncbi:MAG: hypothetical protein KGI60_04065 [Patescibacteria group bacterium]|nr:hypothetical protein [Patescibacteria group bacterium]
MVKILPRCLFWMTFLFGAALSYVVFVRLWFMFFPLWYFPKPTEMNVPLPEYDMRAFGAPVRAGFAKRDITPTGIPWLGGYMPPHPAFIVRDRLWVKSMVLEDARGSRVVLVSCDLVGMLPTDVDAIRAQIHGVPRDHIFIMATHTHSGPDTIGFWLGRREKYMRFLRSQIVDAINASLRDLGPAAIRYGQGDYAGHTVGSDDNPPDTEVSVIQVLRAPGDPVQLVTLVNWACHPDIVEGFAVSADFPHFLAERLRRRIGGETMYVQGAIGAVQPRSDNDDKDTQEYLVKTLGENLGDRVVEIMRHPLPMRDVRIDAQTTTVVAPFENKRDIAFALKYHMVANLLDDHGDIVTQVGKITLGPLTILTAPGEVFPKIWWRLKKGRKHLLMFGLANAEFGYILLPEDFGYDGKHGYNSSVSIGPTFGQRIYEGLKRLEGE